VSREAQIASINLIIREEDGSVVLDHKQVNVDDINRVFKDHPNKEDYKFAMRHMEGAFAKLNEDLEIALGVDADTDY